MLITKIGFKLLIKIWDSVCTHVRGGIKINKNSNHGWKQGKIIQT